jgi:hypothetical protein
MMDGNTRPPALPHRGPDRAEAVEPDHAAVTATDTVHCAGCGRPVGSDDRYCGQCGLPNTAGNRVVAPPDTARSVATGPKRVGPFSIVTAALVLLGATVAWIVLTEGDDGGSAAQEELERDLDPRVSESAAGRTTDRPPPGTPAASSPPAELEVPPQFEMPPDLEVPPPVEVQTITPAALAALEDIDGLRGHYLFVGAGTALLRIDFDTGELDQYALTGAVLGHYRDRLLLLDEHGISTILVDRPLRTPHQLVAVEQALDFHVAEVTLDRWLELSYSPSNRPPGSSIIIDLSEKSIVSTSSDWWAGGGTVAWVPGGGVFQLTDNGYDFLTDGVSGLIGRDSVYIESCTGPDECRFHWVDRSSGETIDRPLLPADLFFGQMVGGGDRLAVFHGPASSRAFYYDTIRGEALPLNVRRLSEIFDTAGRRSEAVSPDDRFLMTLANGRELWLFDLDTDRAFGLDLPVGNARTVALVPKPMPGGPNAG